MAIPVLRLGLPGKSIRNGNVLTGSADDGDLALL